MNNIWSYPQLAAKSSTASTKLRETEIHKKERAIRLMVENKRYQGIKKCSVKGTISSDSHKEGASRGGV